jgi:transcriptional regulator PpsR
MEAARNFSAPKRSFADLDAESAAAVLTAASDIALVLDSKGVIRDLSIGSKTLSLDGHAAWVGKAWIDTVTTESRAKIESLLRDAANPTTKRWRQVNHPVGRGSDVPILYSTVALGKKGRLLAIGRDLRDTAALQQQLVVAQQSMERDYSRLRQSETRYRLLFQIASEAVLVIDAANLKITEANPAAVTLLGTSAKQLVGRLFPDGFDSSSTKKIKQLLDSVRAAGRADEVRVRRADGKTSYLVTASLFRQDDAEHFLVRLTPASSDGHVAPVVTGTRSMLIEVIDHSPDGFVVTEPDGKLLVANRAFLDMAQLNSDDQTRGESLDRWLGRPGVDLDVLLANLRQHGAVRLFATTLRGEYGYVTDVEISAVAVTNGDLPCMGFTIRNVGRRLGADNRATKQLPKSLEQVTELIGRSSLKDLVRDATDVIERLCIEAALELTGDNRASAAEVLGLSRQSLYVKLRRYGLGNLDSEKYE